MLYPQKLGIRSLQMASLSANITEGWSVSKLLPKRGGVAEAPPVSLGDDLGWRLLRVVPGEDRVNLHSVFQNEDGMVCLAQRFKVAQAGKWVVGLGHDGAVRVFVDGKPVFCEPVTRPPIGVDRSQFPLEFTEGEHEVVVAFDLAAGKGWGMRFRFKVPDGQERIQAVFPAPMGR
jgi:hypothetical protein